MESWLRYQRLQLKELDVPKLRARLRTPSHCARRVLEKLAVGGNLLVGAVGGMRCLLLWESSSWENGCHPCWKDSMGLEQRVSS